MAEVQKSSQRNAGSNISSKSDMKELVKKEMDNLLMKHKGVMTLSQRNALMDKFKESDIVDEVMEQYHKQLKKISKYAEEFAKKVIKRYSLDNPYKINQKALKLKQKKGWSDAFFTEFQRQYVTILEGGQNPENTYIKPTRTRMGKMLGTAAPELPQEVGLNVPEKEVPVVNKIIQMFKDNKQLHQKIQRQTFLYTSMAPQVITGTYDKNNDDVEKHVNQLVAFLFANKIHVLENRFLYSNIGRIVKSRNDREKIILPDDQLLKDISEDKNDYVCSQDSPMTDLKMRYEIQIKLWEAVQKFRSGRFYFKGADELLATLNKCRLSTYDMPDLENIQDASSAVRRLFLALSYKPITVYTSSLDTDIGTYVALGDVTYNSLNKPNTKIRKLPILSIRLPNKDEYSAGSEPIRLVDSFKQTKYFMEGRDIVHHQMSVNGSDGVIVFHVNRVANVHHLRDDGVQTNMLNLPLTVAGAADMSEIPVQFENSFHLGEESYYLRSVMVAEKIDVGDGHNMVTGNTTMILAKGENGEPSTFFRYDPLLPSMEKREVGHGVYRGQPITVMPEYNEPYSDIESFRETAKTRGVLFLYEKVLADD